MSTTISLLHKYPLSAYPFIRGNDLVLLKAHVQEVCHENWKYTD